MGWPTMQQVKQEDEKMNAQEVLDSETKVGGSILFIQITICSIMILGILFIKYIEPNAFFEERIKQELTQTITMEEVKQFICELEEMSDKYWRIK